ncbi:RDD family protein [Nocardioides marmoraquaticus]
MSPPTPGPATTWGSVSEAFDDTTQDQQVTGEAVALEVPPASIGLRVVSGLVDVAVQAVLLTVLSVLATRLAPDDALAAAFGVVAVVLVLLVGPSVVETVTGGRSLGKLAVGLRSVRDDAGPVSFHHVLVRHLVGVVEVWLLVGVPAVLAALASRRGKRLGDMVAGTYVVRDRFRLQLPPPVPMPPPLEAWARGADLAPLPVGLQLRLRQLLARTTAFSPEAHERLVRATLAEVSRHVAPPPPAGAPPLAVLAAVAAERRRRDEERLHREAAQRRRLAGRR